MATEMATPDAPQGARQPTLRAERIVTLDLIRGIAVLGILAANIVAFGQPFNAYMWPDAFLTEHDATADWMWVAQLVVIDGKMRGLFTLLFGAGMALFVERAWARGETRWLQARRLGWLLLFGLFHFFFIWRGDILVLYAIAGSVAALALRWPRGRMLGVGIAGYVFGALFFLVTFGLSHFIAETPMRENVAFTEAAVGFDDAKAEMLADDAREAQILTEGNYWDFVSHNFTAHGTDPLFNLFFFGAETLPLMLIGMALYHYGWFSGGVSRKKLLGWGRAGVIVGSLLTLPVGLWAMGTGFQFWASQSALIAFSFPMRIFVTLGLLALLCAYGATASDWLAERLSYAGRAAFTNYIGTSVLMMLIFHPWAGGLFGKLTRPELYIVVVLGWLVMIAWSKPWLERYRYGPLEWLWRCLTYGKWFPMRR